MELLVFQVYHILFRPYEHLLQTFSSLIYFLLLIYYNRYKKSHIKGYLNRLTEDKFLLPDCLLEYATNIIGGKWSKGTHNINKTFFHNYLPYKYNR